MRAAAGETPRDQLTMNYRTRSCASRLKRVRSS